MCCVVLDYWPRILDNRGKPVHVVVRVGLELVTTGLRVRHSDHSFTLPAYTDKSRYFELARETKKLFEIAGAQNSQ